MIIIELTLVSVVFGLILWNRFNINEIKYDIKKLKTQNSGIEHEQELARSRSKNDSEIQTNLMKDLKEAKNTIEKQHETIRTLMKDYNARQERYKEMCARNARRFNNNYKKECVSRSEIVDMTHINE